MIDEAKKNNAEKNNAEIKQKKTVNAQDIHARIEKAESVLAKLRIFPEDWISQSGETKQETEEKLENTIENLKAMLAYSQEQEENTAADFASAAGVGMTFDAAAAKAATEQNEREALRRRIRNKYYQVNGVYTPVMESNARMFAKWEAVVGKTAVSGGRKYSEVMFVKDANGLTSRAKPSEKMDFSEKTRDQRLPYVDTVLQGSAEIKAYNLVYGALSEVFAEMCSLPDDENEAAASLREKAVAFTDAEFIKDMLPLELLAKIDDVDDLAERIGEIIKTLLYLREIDSDGREFIPSADSNYKMTPFIKEKFAEFARLINRQLGLADNELLADMAKRKEAPDWENLTSQGMTVIVGPRGSGKNKLVEHYAAISNRPLFRYVCSPDKEERDLTYDIELSDGEVIKVPTRILTAISTPNAILELDEINLLRPSVAKFFNALFDSDRSVFLSDQVIHAIKGVVFVGLMNPADYNGVEDLPETIDDRSNTMALGYPPFKIMNMTDGMDMFTYDEALILKNYITPVMGFSDKQFVQIWEKVVNGKGAVSVPAEIFKVVKDLKNMILIAQRTRQTVEACKTRSGDVQMKRDISLRGTIAAASFYSENRLWEADLSQLAGWNAPWTAAQYAVAMTYLPHTETYRKGQQDKQSFRAILTEGLSV